MRSNRGFQYISQALDLERFTMFTFSPIKQRLDLLCDYVRTDDARRRAAAATTRSSARQIARLATDAEVARVLGLRVVAASMKGEKVAGHAAADDRVVAVQAVRDGVLAPARERVDGHRRAGQPAAGAAPKTAPMEGRAESTYRYTVIDTIGGGASEIQKNIIARRGLGLPKNF